MSTGNFGRYSIVRKIGSGGMAEVFLARSRGAQGTEKMLVIKKIHPALSSNDRFIDMFVDEARVAMRLNHSNIVQVYAFEQIDGDHILAMEYVDGCDLQEIQVAARNSGTRLPWGLCAFLAAEIAKGLDYAHSRTDDHGEPLDIVHRDISPQNVLISQDGAVKIADFGIAKARSLHEEALGEVKGKLGYMSPEQAGGLPVDLRSDIFSLGVVLHELLTGRPLLSSVPGPDPLPTLRDGNHPSPRELDPAVPRELDEVVARAMNPDPNRRFNTIREMAQALGIYLHSERRIYDSHTLESWLRENIPRDVLRHRDSDDLTRKEPPVTDDSVPDEKTIPLRAIGEVEQRAVVLVSARIILEPQPERATVNAELLRLADEICYKADGVMTRTGDGLRVFLGLIHSSMEDAIRGLRLALDLIDVTRSLSRDNRMRIDMGISVNRGYVQSRKTSQHAAPTFEPELELVENAQALLEAASDGEIVAGGGVYRLTRQEYNFRSNVPVATVQPDGTDAAQKQLKVYVLEGARSRRERSLDMPGASGDFLGRDLELRRLEDCRIRTAKHLTTILRVAGEMGIGKSRLVYRFLESLDSGDTSVVSAECLFGERHTALSAVAAVTRAALGMREDDPVAVIRSRISELLDQAPIYLQRQVDFMARLLSSPEKTWSRARDRQRHLTRSIASGLGVILSLIAKRSGFLALVVENAHWMDGQSADVLSEMAGLEGKVPILVLLVGQPGTLKDRKILGLKDLEIKELPDHIVRKIVEQRLGQGPEIEGISNQIVERSQGNPFFAGEIIDSLTDRGILAPVTNVDQEDTTAARYRQTKPGAIRLPTTMEGLAASHIDALDSPVRTTLRVASAIGASFTLETLAGLVGRSVQRDVDVLVEKGFLVAAPSSDEGLPMFRFARPMVREAAYAGLSRQDKLRVHRILADELIRGVEKGAAVPSSRIAWHLENGNDPERAGAYYLEGGVAAMAVYSNRRALRLLDRAIELLPRSSAARYEALRSKERALKDLGHHEERAAAVDEMEKIVTELGDGPRMIQATNLRAQLLYDVGDYLLAAQSVTRAMELGTRIEHPFHRVESMRLLAYIAGQSGRLEQALECCNGALGIIPEGQEGLYLRARVLGVKGAILLEMGKLDLAPNFLAEALVLFRHLGKRRNESTALSNLALVAHARGNLLEGIDFLERAVLLDRQNRDISARGRKLAAIGSIWVELGGLDQGHSFLEEGLRICRDNREPLGEVEADLGLAELWLVRNDPDGARQILREVARGDLVSRSRLLQVRHRQLYAMALLRTGRMDEALAAAEEATRIARSAEMKGEVVHGAVTRGLALLAVSGPAAALPAVDLVDDMIRELGTVRRLEVARWYQALVLHGAGDFEKAGIALDLARAEVERKSQLLTSPGHRASYRSHPVIGCIIEGLPGEPGAFS